jgi:hypothetical protein
MSTTVEASHEYDHPIETVIGAFTDPEFYLEKFEGVGARDVEVLASSDEDGVFTIETRREVPLDVPGALKTFLGSWTTVLQNEEWVEGEDGQYLNEIEINSEGVPALITGTMTLIPTEGGCVNEVVMEIDCRIPLIGRKLESFVADSTAEQLDAEYEFIQSYLDGQ